MNKIKNIEGYIVDVVKREIFKGRVFYDSHIVSIEKDDTIDSNVYILPGLIDAHVHIESSMLSPLEYSKIAVRHGVVAAVTDPHEIANVCGIDGVNFMIDNAKLTPMKIYFGAPSCVPATMFETSGADIQSEDIDLLFRENKCSHLSEMMNYPGVINGDNDVLNKINTAKKHGKRIDGHAPLLHDSDLRAYVTAGISTDHECTSISEAEEKIKLGMKIMLRESSAAKDFENLLDLIDDYSDSIMFCTDDCHPDELLNGYINRLVQKAIAREKDIFDILQSATINTIKHYQLEVGYLQESHSADFIVVNNLNDFIIQKTIINGQLVFANSHCFIDPTSDDFVNNFYTNNFTLNDLLVKKKGDQLNVISVVDGSLLTDKYIYNIPSDLRYIDSNTEVDVLKVIVVNRYKKSKISIGFIKGIGIKSGSFASSVAHDSHNIIAVGCDDASILKAITLIQGMQGGLAVVSGNESLVLPLPIGGLMSNNSCVNVAKKYQELTSKVKELGSSLHAPFMSLAFMSLLVIPHLKIGDKGLFDVDLFEFINLQQ